MVDMTAYQQTCGCSACERPAAERSTGVLLQVHPVVGAYMEFVERKVLPQHQYLAAAGGLREQHRRDGFEAESATNIFASTTVAAAAAQQQGVL
jgi:hypothetical protein